MRVEIGRSLWITRTRYHYLLIVNFTSNRFGENKKMIPSVTGKYFQSCLLKWKKKLWKENSYKCASLNERYGKPTKSSKNLKFHVPHARCKAKETYLEKIAPFVDLSDVSISPLAAPTRRHDNTVLVWFLDTGASKETTIEGCDFRYMIKLSYHSLLERKKHKYSFQLTFVLWCSIDACHERNLEWWDRVS